MQNIISECWKIRLFEKYLLDLYSTGMVRGTTHTCLGQEQVGVLISQFLTPSDLIFSNHRCHGHFLALTKDYEGLLYEIMGHHNGVNAGRAGSQHIVLPRRFYSNGIQGGLLPFAVGYANALKDSIDREGIAIAIIGDGTFGEGVLFESLNLAASKGCPVLFIVEDNEISQSTLTASVQSGNSIEKIKSFGIESVSIPIGTPLDKMALIAQKSIAKVRESKKPFAIHWSVDRHGPHSKGDDSRTKDFLNNILARDYLEKATLEDSKFSTLRDEAEEKIASLFENAVVELKTTPKSVVTRIQTELRGSYKEINPYNRQVNGRVKIREILQTLVDEGSCIFGEDVEAPYGGAFKVTSDLVASDKTNLETAVNNMPISEAGIVGFGAGYSVGSETTTIVEIMFGDFMTLTVDQIVNHVSKFCLTHKNSSPSLIVRTAVGGGRGYGATHSQNLSSLFLGVPAIDIVMASPYHQLDLYINQFKVSKVLSIWHEPKLEYGRNGQILLNIKNADKIFNLHLYNDVQSRQQWLVLKSKFSDKDQISVVTTALTLRQCVKASSELFIEDEVITSIACPLLLNLDTVDFDFLFGKSKKLVIVDEGFIHTGFHAHCASVFSEQHDLTSISQVGLNGQFYSVNEQEEDSFMVSVDDVKEAIRLC